MIEFKQSGGIEKLKEVSKQDLKDGVKIFKDATTYDIPQWSKKLFNDIKRQIKQ